MTPEELTAALAAYTGEIEVIKGCPLNPEPVPRSGYIDPDWKLTRKKPISRNRAEALAALAERKKLPKEKRPPTLGEIAAQHGIGHSTLSRRLRQGMSMSEAVRQTNPNLRRTRQIKNKPDGESSLNELARRYGIAWSTLRRRLDRGMTIDQALQSPAWQRTVQK